MTNTTSEFRTVFNQTKSRDAFYRFLQVVFHLYPENKFHHLIGEVTEAETSDEDIYKTIQNRLPSIKPFLSELTYALPALKTQKKEMTRQMLDLLPADVKINGYVEIGSPGRYISDLRKHLSISEPIYLINDVAPTYSPADIMERGQLTKIGTFVESHDFEPISPDAIPSESVDLVTCLIGLHHTRPEQLTLFVASIRRILRPGGWFILRDHDVKTDDMATFVSLVHTVFNLGLNIDWETDQKDYKDFKPIEEWSRIVTSVGFIDAGKRLLQANDPSDNTMVLFTKK
ncbi:class I SAM-dependent methyltransferase [Spirosoma endophyticum]|uniref:Methyltransferase domain-containing protein n=1 Tax=Spirosoma endophyticum TaxID=662367 RepID=A0A1I1LM14_9BACT|nr:class I SAM-dependent methyltransferase [Spirosoma endophyticum]SFC74015.1 Methyltransferase domain-containing protein [Spirosoma endophyticum]